MSAYPMNNLPISWSHRLVHSLPVRIIFVILTTALVACICPLIFLINRTVSSALLKIVSIILVGLAGGFSASALLSTNLAFIRYITAWISTVIGLMILHLLTNNYAGIAILPVAQINLESISIGQLALSMLIAGLATLAWKPIPTNQASPTSERHQPRTKISKPKQPVKRQKIRKTHVHRQAVKKSLPVTRHVDWKKIGVQWEEQLKALKIKTNTSLSKSNAKVTNWFAKLSSSLYTETKFRRPAIRMRSSKHHHRPFSRKKTAVRLVGKTENRCPYCLEIVKPDDPRGIKICPECNTFHHADCWAITGHCQVPHFHE
jgi:hypothetical protein